MQIIYTVNSPDGNTQKCAPKPLDPEPGHCHFRGGNAYLIDIRPKFKSRPGFHYNAVTILLPERRIPIEFIIYKPITLPKVIL